MIADKPTPLVRAALRARCPRCENAPLFDGWVRFAPRCRACGLDYSAFNVGDGPAAFLILIVGALITAMALVLQVRAEPPFWVHIILWVPLTTALVILSPARFQGGTAHPRISQQGARGPRCGAGRRREPVTRRLPIVATLVVGLAVAAMIGLGFWQLARLKQKEAALDVYRANMTLPQTAYPVMNPADQRYLFRALAATCLRVTGWQVTGGAQPRRHAGAGATSRPVRPARKGRG